MPKPHVHHWVLPTPDGPTSLGRCKHCGVSKEFANADTPVAWGSTIWAKYNYFGVTKRNEIQSMEGEQRCNE